MQPQDTPTGLDPEFDRQPLVAHIETDRFCERCGYNLRTQPVRREAQTDLFLCRCPECGGYQPARDAATAGRAWLQRLGTLLLFVWIMVVLWAVIGLFAAQVGMTFVPLEELTTHRQITIRNPPAMPGGASTTIIIGGSTIGIPGLASMPSGGSATTWRREVRDSYEYYGALMILSHGASFGLGFSLAMMLVVAAYHWRRWAYLVPICLVPPAAAWLASYVWGQDHPHLHDWATPYVIGQAAAHFAGGLSGILLGRPLARLIVTLILPPRVRQVLAFLWLADGKQQLLTGSKS